jgi:hypothetical protein
VKASDNGPQPLAATADGLMPAKVDQSHIWISDIWLSTPDKPRQNWNFIIEIIIEHVPFFKGVATSAASCVRPFHYCCAFQTKKWMHSETQHQASSLRSLILPRSALTQTAASCNTL